MTEARSKRRILPSISCCKGKWYVRRFDPDKVENGHIYSSVKEEEVFIFTIQHPVPLFSLCTKSLIAVLNAKQLSEENGGGPFC